ncbi:Conserved_hypothetical protein [Hexamita inflata]|uniref:Uncharacterized protein n=1 Tax=Hexamita inflata TaxID=28002 RepID=A0ABP1HRQ3_9EUKA
MFIFKPINTLDLYFSINNGNVEMIDRNYNNLYKHPIKFKFTPRQAESFCFCIQHYSLYKGAISDTSYQVPPTQFTSIRYCKNKIYFSVLDHLFVINEDFSVDLVQYIKEFGKGSSGVYTTIDYGGGQMFTMNNKLYVHNQSSKLFELKRNNQLKCINNKLRNKFYCQFCDMVYAVDNSGVFLVNHELQLICIYQLCNIKILFAQGCILIAVDSSEQIFYVLNMLDAKVIVVKQDEINLVQYQVELGPTGTQLKNEILIKLFGFEFPYRMTTYYDNFHNNNMLMCQNQFIKQFFSKNMSLVTQIQWNQTLTHFNNLQSQVKDFTSRISKQVSNLLMQLKVSSSIFVPTFNESATYQ